jgi:hypothetical protein
MPLSARLLGAAAFTQAAGLLCLCLIVWYVPNLAALASWQAGDWAMSLSLVAVFIGAPCCYVAAGVAAIRRMRSEQLGTTLMGILIVGFSVFAAALTVVMGMIIASLTWFG